MDIQGKVDRIMGMFDSEEEARVVLVEALKTLTDNSTENNINDDIEEISEEEAQNTTGGAKAKKQVYKFVTGTLKYGTSDYSQSAYSKSGYAVSVNTYYKNVYGLVGGTAWFQVINGKIYVKRYSTAVKGIIQGYATHRNGNITYLTWYLK